MAVGAGRPAGGTVLPGTLVLLGTGVAVVLTRLIGTRVAKPGQA
ncbi:hypothetical protein ABZ260_29130 [Streptosporangium sp. NPDC006013]